MIRLVSLLTLPVLLAGAANAQAQYTLDIDPAQSANTWWANTSLGNVVGAPTRDFQFDGTVGLLLGAAGAPFGTGQFNGGDAFTIPDILAGKIPNPIPFSPPLARIEIRYLHAGVNSPSFAVSAANGAFSTDVVMDMLSGEIYVDPLFGTPTTTPVAGLQSDPFTVSGTIVEAGGLVVLDAPLHPSFPITGSISGSFGVDGNLHASAPVQNVNMVLSASPLVGGQNATFDVVGGHPNAATWLAYSLAGLGSTSVPQLGIVLGIANPAVGAGPTLTGGNGAVSWTLPIPPASGLPVWLQACQQGLTSNVVATAVQ